MKGEREIEYKFRRRRKKQAAYVMLYLGQLLKIFCLGLKNLNRKEWRSAIEGGVYTSDFFHDLEFKIGTIFWPEYLFHFVERQYLTEIKLQIANQIVLVCRRHLTQLAIDIYPADAWDHTCFQFSLFSAVLIHPYIYGHWQ